MDRLVQELRGLLQNRIDSASDQLCRPVHHRSPIARAIFSLRSLML